MRVTHFSLYGVYLSVHAQDSKCCFASIKMDSTWIPPPPPRSDEYYLVGDIIIGVSLSESHLVRSMAGSTMFVYIYIYMYICRSTFRRHIFDVCPLQFCTQWSAYRLTVRKWLPLANRCIFPAEGFNFLQFPLDPCQSQTHTTPSLC